MRNFCLKSHVRLFYYEIVLMRLVSIKKSIEKTDQTKKKIYKKKIKGLFKKRKDKEKFF